MNLFSMRVGCQPWATRSYMGRSSCLHAQPEAVIPALLQLAGDAMAVGTSPILPLSLQLLSAPGWSVDGRRMAPGPALG